jgi:predicted transcriptional regulator
MNYRNKKIPDRERLFFLYEKYNNIEKISKLLNVSPSTVSRWLKKLDIPIKKAKIDENLKKIIDDLKVLSLKEIEIKYNISLINLKKRLKRRIKIPETIYSIDRLKKIISLYDVNNQGFTKQIINDDINVFNSIIIHTSDHKLYGDKITEKVYRLINNIPKNTKICCSNCKTPLKFYTMELGYGNSDKKICQGCISICAGISLASQKLFNILYENLENKELCFFQGLNYEKKFNVTKSIKNNLKDDNINKNYYMADFTYGKKVIEFDGVRWHKNIKKEKAKDKFFSYIGYEILHIVDLDFYKDPEKVIKECLNFLN